MSNATTTTDGKIMPSDLIMSATERRDAMLHIMDELATIADLIHVASMAANSIEDERERSALLCVLDIAEQKLSITRAELATARSENAKADAAS